MIRCNICKYKFKMITQLHLKKKHYMNLERYLKLYPNAKIIEDYKCELCEIIVDYRKSSRSKYCKKCAIIINKYNVLKNVRKYNKRKQKYIEKHIIQSNKDFGILIKEDSVDTGLTRIDNTHSGWDFIPKGQNILGTINENDLKPNEDGRIPAYLRLKKLLDRYKRR